MLGKHLLKYCTKANKQAYRYSERDLKSRYTDQATEYLIQKKELLKLERI